MKDIIVIGGGAAGMIAAIAASEYGRHVILLEKNEKLGKKLFITGKGRCNVTNVLDLEGFLDNVCSNGRFLYSAFHNFDNREIMGLLERAGCPLKTERGGRVFPVSDHSSDVIAALVKMLKKNNVDVRTDTEVREIVWNSDAEETGKDSAAKIQGVMLTDGQVLYADAVIVCTGGLSYSSTGSTGNGLRFAEETGHRITECRPSLVPLETAEEWCKDLMGLSLRNVELRMNHGKKELYREQGEMLFTHFGISGPLALTASCYIGRARESVKVYIDLKPALSEEQLDKRLLRDFEEQKNKMFKNALGGLFPSKLIPVMVKLSDIDPEKAINEITRQERKNFVTLIKNLPLNVTGTRPYGEAIITQGGVSVKDVNPSTMESKRVQGLYFAGEVLDLDAHTGGFNLQIAWSTGHLAGACAAEKE